MAFTNSNDYLTGRKPVLSADSFGLCAVRYALILATADLALNVIGVIGVLPAGSIPVDILFDSDDLDSNASPAIAWSVAIGNLALKDASGTTSSDAANTLISTVAADGGAAWATGVTTSQAGGQAQFCSKAISRVLPVPYDRYIVLKATTAAATAVSGEVGLTIKYRAA